MVSVLSLCRFPTLFRSVMLHVCAFQIFLENLSLFKTAALRYAGACVCVCLLVHVRVRICVSESLLSKYMCVKESVSAWDHFTGWTSYVPFDITINN